MPVFKEATIAYHDNRLLAIARFYEGEEIAGEGEHGNAAKSYGEAVGATEQTGVHVSTLECGDFAPFTVNSMLLTALFETSSRNWPNRGFARSVPPNRRRNTKKTAPTFDR